MQRWWLPRGVGDRDRAVLARDTVEEHLEEEVGVSRASTRLRVELDRKKGLRLVDNAFVRVVVRVHEELLPPGGERGGVDCVAVVLRRDVAPVRARVDARLVRAAIAVLHLVGVAPSGERQ